MKEVRFIKANELFLYKLNTVRDTLGGRVQDLLPYGYIDARWCNSTASWNGPEATALYFTEDVLKDVLEDSDISINYQPKDYFWGVDNCDFIKVPFRFRDHQKECWISVNKLNSVFDAQQQQELARKYPKYFADKRLGFFNESLNNNWLRDTFNITLSELQDLCERNWNYELFSELISEFSLESEVYETGIVNIFYDDCGVEHFNTLEECCKYYGEDWIKEWIKEFMEEIYLDEEAKAYLEKLRGQRTKLGFFNEEMDSEGRIKPGDLMIGDVLITHQVGGGINDENPLRWELVDIDPHYVDGGYPYGFKVIDLRDGSVLIRKNHCSVKYVEDILKYVVEINGKPYPFKKPQLGFFNEAYDDVKGDLVVQFTGRVLPESQSFRIVNDDYTLIVKLPHKIGDVFGVSKVKTNGIQGQRQLTFESREAAQGFIDNHPEFSDMWVGPTNKKYYCVKLEIDDYPVYVSEYVFPEGFSTDAWEEDDSVMHCLSENDRGWDIYCAACPKYLIKFSNTEAQEYKDMLNRKEEEAESSEPFLDESINEAYNEKPVNALECWKIRTGTSKYSKQLLKVKIPTFKRIHDFYPYLEFLSPYDSMGGYNDLCFLNKEDALTFIQKFKSETVSELIPVVSRKDCNLVKVPVKLFGKIIDNCYIRKEALPSKENKEWWDTVSEKFPKYFKDLGFFTESIQI